MSGSWSKPLKLLWASPCSALGLAIAALPWAAGGTARWSDGALEVTYRADRSACGARARRFPIRGIVFGHVILAVTREELARIGPHERIHVEQYERWGPLFLLAYAASSLWQLARGRDAYRHNRFELEAREHLGGAGTSHATTPSGPKCCRLSCGRPKPAFATVDLRLTEARHMAVNHPRCRQILRWRPTKT